MQSQYENLTPKKRTPDIQLGTQKKKKERKQKLGTLAKGAS